MMFRLDIFRVKQPILLGAQFLSMNKTGCISSDAGIGYVSTGSSTSISLSLSPSLSVSLSL
jgi:hypothetical protein